MPSTSISTLSLHDALPISRCDVPRAGRSVHRSRPRSGRSSSTARNHRRPRSEEHTSELQSRPHLVCRPPRSPLFPYTTLFRSHVVTYLGQAEACIARGHDQVAAQAQLETTADRDRKSTRLNSSHVRISYAVHLDLHSFPTRRSSDLTLCRTSGRPKRASLAATIRSQLKHSSKPPPT